MSEEKIFDPEADLEENKRKVVGACPKCGSDVYDYGWGWACSKGRDVCDVKESKTVLGHQITDEEFEKLLVTGSTDLIEDFVSKNDKVFSAKLVIKDGEIKFDFPERTKKEE